MSKLNPNFDIDSKRIAFAFNYSEDNPIAIRDFTTSLNGLNELYSMISEGFILTDCNELMVLDIPKYKDRKSELHIQRIEKGSILAALTDPNPWIEGIELVAAIITIIDFLKNCFTSNDPNDPNIKNELNIIGKPYFKKVISSLKRFLQIIKTPDEKIIMKDTTGETEIDYHLKEAILDKCKLINKMNIRNC